MVPSAFILPSALTRDAVRENQPAICLADRLVSSDLADACGVARARLLLTDGSGPIYTRPTAEISNPR